MANAVIARNKASFARADIDAEIAAHRRGERAASATPEPR
jgi:hypothetical protein